MRQVCDILAPLRHNRKLSIVVLKGSALATELAGVEQPKRIILFGAGAQITHHALIFLQVYPSISHCTIVNRSLNDRLRALIDRLKKRFPVVSIEGLKLNDEVRLKAALNDSDLVCTATSSTEALFDEKWLKQSAHVNLVRASL